MSPDGSRLYFADSATRTIYVYEMIEPEGRLGARRIFARTPEGASPDGRIDRTIGVPTCQPSCVCAHFADLIHTRRNDVDLAPFYLVADAFLCGRRVEVAPFLE